KNLYDKEKIELRIVSMMMKTLQECGDMSFMTWAVIEEPRLSNERELLFKHVLSCDKTKSSLINNSDNSIIDIKYQNTNYMTSHSIDRTSLEFIESDNVLPSGDKLTNLNPVWFNLLDEKGHLTDEAQFLKIRTPSFWKIIKDTKIAVKQLGIVLVKAS